MSARDVTHDLDDPLERVWVETARRVGLRALEPDERSPPFVLREICRSLVEGPGSLEGERRGGARDRDASREDACLRLQALLCDRHGLRAALTPASAHRADYASLPRDPLAPRDDRDDRAAIRLARVGATRSERPPWAPHVRAALLATRAIVEAAAPFAALSSPCSRIELARPSHPSGLPASPDAGERTCAGCGWQSLRRTRAHCVQAGRAVDPGWPACERFDAALDCQRCAACCLEAYGVVELGRRERFVRAHPEHVRRLGGRIVLERVDGRCPVLEGTGPYACRTYEERPRTCREFEVGRANCLEARRRLGLSL